jgi:hypothetical protein
MLRTRVCLQLALLTVSIFFATGTFAQTPTVKALGNDTLSFEESRSNVGDGQAAFRSSVSGVDFLFYESQAAIDITSAGASAGKPIRLSLSGASRGARLSPEGQLPGIVNYISSDADTSRTGLRTWSGLRYQEIYPGIDLVYYGSRGQLEYDFVVAPQHDPGTIALDISSAEHISIERGGELNISSSVASLRFSKPVIYQLAADGSRELIAGNYVMKNPGQIGFDIPNWDPTRPLVIDPVLAWSSFPIGSTTSDTYYVGRVDSSGNVYLAGHTSGALVVEKIAAGGGSLIYRAVLSAVSPLTYSATPEDMRIDAAGNAYIVGYSNPNFPVTTTGYLQSVTSGNHAFVAVLNAAGTKLTYATYLAGTTNTSSFPDQANGVALDSAKNVYVTGWTYSSTFPTTTGVYQTKNPNGQSIGFVTKINPTLSGAASLLYSTYLSGPTSPVNEVAIAVDGSDNAYVVGTAQSDFPVTTGAFAYDGEDDTSGGIYVTKLNSTATTLDYSAYLGYNGNGGSFGIAVDGSGDAYVTGPVGVEDFPTTVGAYQVTYPSGFVSELNPAGTALIYSTFLGGATETTYPTDIAIEPGCTSACVTFITGYTGEDDLALTLPIQDFNASYANGSSGNDVFVTELNGTGTAAVYSTYIGGSSDDSSWSTSHSPSISADTTGDAYVVGETSSVDFPVTLTATPQRNTFAFEIGATAAAKGLVYPTTLAFPTDQPVGAASTPLTFTLRNIGSTAMTISSMTPSPADYAETNTCGASLAGGAECAVTVTFTPSTAASRAGTLTIATSGSNSPTVVTLTGTGVAQPFLTLNPTTLTFSNQTVDSASPYQTITVGNSATTALTFSNPAFTPSANFSQTNNCGATLAHNATCTVNVAFLPTENGAVTGTLVVGSNTSGLVPTTFVNLSGNGVVGAPALTLSSAGLVFNAQDVGIPSPAQTLYITNTSDVPVSIFGISITGTGSTDYTTASCVPITIYPGSYCGIRVTFDPTTSGTRGPATVTLADSTTVATHSFTVTGTGVTPTLTLAIDPSSLKFAQLGVGSTSSYYPVTITNTGNAPVVIERAYTTGDFRLYETTCVGSLRVGSSCTNYVEFAPAAAGALSGTLVVEDNATGSPQSIPLTGTGLTAAPAAVASPDAIDFGTQAVATTTVNQLSVNLYNIGNVPLEVTGTTITGTDPGDYQIPDNGCLDVVVAAGRSCAVYLTFTPGAATTRPATLNFVDAAGTQSVPLTGTGVAATFSLVTVPAALTFQAQEEHLGSPTQYVYLINTGTAAVTISGVTSGSTDYTGETGCNTVTIQPNGNCYLGITLTPTVSGTDNSTLKVSSNATGSPQTITLTGSGAATLATMQLNPAGLAFPTQVVSTTSAIQPITLVNNSASTVSAIAIATSGTDKTDFAISSNSCGTTLAAATQCSFYVSFTPGAAGARAGAVTITDSAGTQTAQLAGYGVASTSSAVLVDSSLQFPSETISFTSPGQSAAFSNTGNSPLTITSVVLGGTNPGDFAMSTGCSTVSKLGPFSSCNVSATFTPTAAGKRTATVTIAYTGATGSPVTINLSGTGVTGSLGLTVSPTTIAFPPTVATTPSPINPYILLTNTGTSPVTISSIVLAGTDPADFAISNSCPNPLPQGPISNTCTVGVTFTPAAAATYTATVTVTDNAGAATVVNLSGTGVADTKLLTVTPTTLVYGPQVSGTTSAVQYITVTNTGNFNVTFTNVTVSPADYALSNSCSGVFGPGSSCTIGVTFTAPSTAGAVAGTVTITDNSTVGAGTQKVTLSGTGIATSSDILLSQKTVVFDAQIVKTLSPPQLVYYYNQGNTSSTISSGVLSGANAADFSVSSSSCATTSASPVSPLSYCYYRITFTPSAAGTRIATLTITDSDPGSPRTVAISGTGISTDVPEVGFFPTSLTFATQGEGTTSPAQNVNLTNNGQANLTISSIALTGTDSGNYAIASNNCPATLAAGFSCNIAVTFSPIAIGAGLTASLTVTDNATGSPQSVPITGTGKAGALPTVTLTPASLAFPNVALNTASKPQVVTVKNTGAAALTFGSAAIGITGTVPSDFSQTNTCNGTSVAIGGTCTISVTFTPSTLENQTGAVSLADNAANTPQSVPITGNGAEPAVFLSPDTLTFTSQTDGTTSAPQTVTVQNYGNAPLTLGTIAVSAQYVLSTNGCGPSGTVLTAGSSCTISVEFKPTGTGTISGSLSIPDNAEDSPQTVGLSGTGAAAAVKSGRTYQ